jgi:hypothetical protein
MVAKNVSVAGFALVVIIAVVLALAGSPIVAADDQASAPSKEIKIDNFSFEP